MKEPNIDGPSRGFRKCGSAFFDWKASAFTNKIDKSVNHVNVDN